MILKLLSTLGLTFIVTHGFIFKRFRKSLKNVYLKKLFCCPMCFGLWSGIMIYFQPFTMVDFAFASSFLGFIIYKIFID